MPVRVSAISFLNPAPLLYNFEHEPTATALRSRYLVHYTTPAQCAAELHAGVADLGLIPIAQLTPELSIVPGCVIASRQEVRSILLLVRCPAGRTRDAALRQIRSIAADSASRSSAAYVRTVLKCFYANEPLVEEQQANPLSMLGQHDAALLIGDPALLARERRHEVEAAVERQTGEQLLWLDLAQLWRELTGLPWVAAVWALRPESLSTGEVAITQVVADLQASRDAGLAHTEELIQEWLPKLPLKEETIRTYLTRNIYYMLDADCLKAITTFRLLAAEAGVLPVLPGLNLIQS